MTAIKQHITTVQDAQDYFQHVRSSHLSGIEELNTVSVQLFLKELIILKISFKAARSVLVNRFRMFERDVLQKYHSAAQTLVLDEFLTLSPLALIELLKVEQILIYPYL